MKDPWRLYVSCAFMTLACWLASCTTAFAQKEGRTPGFWQSQAKEITGELVRDSADLSPIDRSMLWARLGDAWWEDDRERALAWLQRAVEEVTFAPDQEPSIDRNRRIATVRALLRIVARRDDRLYTRLANWLLSLGDEKDDQGKTAGDANADALVDAALAIVKADPRRAAALGSQSLRLGRTYKLTDLLLELRERDGNLADGLFKDALNLAQATRDVDLLASLVTAAYPKLQVPSYRGVSSPPDLRANLLAVLVASLQPVQAQDGDRSSCGFAQITAPLLNEIIQVFPEQAAIVRIQISKCLSTSPRIEDALRDQPLKTVDDLLAAAGQEQNPIKAGLFLVRAAVLAGQKNDFNRAIDILDSLTSEQREMLGDGWENVRVSFAVGAAINYGTQKDYSGIQRAVAAVPADLRPFVQIPVAENLLSNKGDRDFG